MYIEDFIRRIVDGWRALLISIVAFVVLMGVFLAVYPPQYEATATLRIGDVPPGNPIETMPGISARLRNSHVLRATLRELNLPVSDSQIDHLRRAIRVVAIDDNSVQFVLRWPDHDQAIALVKQLGDDTIAAHTAAQTAASASITDRLRLNQARALGSSPAGGQPAGAGGTQSNEDSGANRVLHALQAQSEQAIAALAVTTPTVFEFPPDVTDNPVFPKRGAMMGLALLLGIAFGIAWIFASRPRAAKK